MRLPRFLLALTFCALPLCAAVAADSAAAPTPSPSDSARFVFPPADLMNLGVYYYPEAWPENEWGRDMANMHKLGMEFVHLGEFAWAFMEPTESHYDFAWLDHAIQLAADNGMKVVLCTPSPAPPVWLTEKHPEVLMIDADGRQMIHGTRQQATWSSDVYRAYVGKIVDQLGRRYGHDPRVWGWQLDNELSHYGKEPDYSEASQHKFQAWLQRKYGTIDALNRAWGDAFWSQMYQRFDQIRLPNPKQYVAQFNPHQMLDSQRWFADEAADYLRFQTNILRKYCGHRQWITTNYMHDFGAVNPTLTAADFDVTSWTHYPVHGNPNRGPLGFRMGDPYVMSFAGDFMRSINGQAGIMELQPGQVNWGDVNPQPYPGAVHLWLMRIFATGSKFACTYRYREPLSGAEMYHYGLAGTDGVTPTTGGLQYAQAEREITALRKIATPGAPMPAAYAARRSAILYNYDNRWDIDNHKQNKDWDTYGHMLKYYAALKRAGAPVDVITEAKDFSPYAFLVAPAYQLVDPQLVARWKAYVENGGHLILSCRTGQKDRNGHLWEGPWAEPILGLIGANIKFYDTLPAPNVAHVTAGTATYAWSTWGDVLVPHEGAGVTTLATYADQFYAGGIAAITRKLGKGDVTYIGVDSQNGALEAQLVHDELARAGANPADYADGFLVDWRDGLWIATNFTDKPQPAPVPENASVIFGERDVPIAGVTVWK
ncbi:MAG TPA: beta-galactosidase [Opitutaceae bacterium]|nr:beta-galactosidase [Opitutaceae bacterium]